MIDTVLPPMQSIGVKIKIPRVVTPSRTIESIPEVLRHIRVNNNTGKPLTQREVAKILRVPPITYRSWENGLRKPSALAAADLEKFVKDHLVKGGSIVAERAVKAPAPGLTAQRDGIKKCLIPDARPKVKANIHTGVRVAIKKTKTPSISANGTKWPKKPKAKPKSK